MSHSSFSLPAKQSSFSSIPSYQVFFATSAENRGGRDACGSGGGGGVSALQDSAS